MALSSIAEVRAAGGLDDQRAPELFRYPDEPMLDAEVSRALSWAVGWLKSRVASTYYTGAATLETERDELFKGAEQDMALYRLLPRLKIRKVSGRHAPYQQEGSDRWEALIDTELLNQVNTAIQPYLDPDLTSEPYSIGLFGITRAIDRQTDVDGVIVFNQRNLDEATGAD